MIIFETEQAAHAVLELTRGIPADAPVKIITQSVLEVVLQA